MSKPEELPVIAETLVIDVHSAGVLIPPPEYTVTMTDAEGKQVIEERTNEST